VTRRHGTGHTGTPRALALAGCFAYCAGLAGLAGCGVNDVRLTVVNASGRALDSLAVRGEFGERRIRPLAPGDSATVHFGVHGEDAFTLRGRAGEGAIAPGMAAYAESGYRVRATVDSLLVVEWETALPAY
jgi:hypothetical protein